MPRIRSARGNSSSGVRLVAIATVAGCIVLGAMGAGASGATKRPVVDLYSSVPLQGASKLESGSVVNGLRLALEEAKYRAGKVTIRFTSLDDSTASRGRWDPAATRRNATRVAKDSRAIGYIGDFNSGATEVSLPILNRAGVPQVSPASTYLGLTQGGTGTLSGEPKKYYPSGKRTFLRLVPTDRIQSDVILKVMKADGCTRLAVANDGGAYGLGIARLIVDRAGARGIAIVDAGSGAGERIGATPSAITGQADRFRAAGADCFIFGGQTSETAARLYEAVVGQIPTVRLYGPDAVCEVGFTDPLYGGMSAAAGDRFQCLTPTRDLSSYAAGRRFQTAYRKAYGVRWADPYAIYGYEAGRLFVDTLTKLGSKATSRAAVLKALLATRNRKGAIGTYSFDSRGDTSLKTYGVYRVDDGAPVYSKIAS